MATTFLEPGGDATGNVALKTAGGMWDLITGTPTIATDIVHGSHVRSIANANNTNNNFRVFNAVADAGSRYSIYFYIKTLPTATTTFASISTTGNISLITLRVTSAGVLQLFSAAQLGSNGSTLSTGTWYRISLAYTLTSTSINEFRVFKDGATDISVTNGTVSNTGTNRLSFGTVGADVTADFRFSDIYIDNSNSLADTGNVWVTAKRPNANGTVNNFTTQIGAGGSGYGTGHSPQVNERALSVTNGWSVAAVAATTEEYNVESVSTGDIDLTGGTIVDYLGWVYTKALLAETGQIVVNNVSTNISITTADTMFTQIAGSTTYPAGTGTDIGLVTGATVTTVNLYECGIVVAYIPAVTTPKFSNFLLMGVG